MAQDFTVQVQMPASELRDYNAMMQEIAREHDRALPSMIPQVGRFFAQSAAKATPQSRAKRPVEANPNRQGRGSQAVGKRFRFRVFSQRRPARWVYTDDRMDSRRVIKRRGAAKNVWRAMIGKMGRRSTLSGSASAQAAGLRFSAVQTVKSASAYQITMTNSIGYAATITPNVVSASMEKALSRMNKMLQRRKERQEAQFRT